MSLLFVVINMLVYQQGDTLQFVSRDSIVDRWILGEKIERTDSTERIMTTRARVSQDNRYFLFFKEFFFPIKDSVFTEISYYNANRRRLWKETRTGERKISFYLSKIYQNKIYLVDTDKARKNPNLYIINNNNKKRKRIIKEGEWIYIIDYEISPNGQYIVLNTKNPYYKKIWDYIYFIDLKTRKSWTYLFPTCLSCKKTRIKLAVDDSGKAEVVHRNEHRVFSKDGRLIDIFIK